MKNIISTLSEIKQEGDYVYLVKDGNKYHLYSAKIQDSQINSSLQSESILIKQAKLKIEITSIYQEFIKYIMKYTDNLSHILLIQQKIEKKLFDVKNQQILEEETEEQILPACKNQTQDIQKQIEEESLIKQGNTNKGSKILQSIVESYQNFILKILLENSQDFQIQFKNPLSIYIKDIRNLQYDNLSLNLSTNYYIASVSGERADYRRSQLIQIQFLLQEQNIKLYSEHLQIQQKINFMRDSEYIHDAYYENTEDVEEQFSLPNICSNYIYLHLNEGCNYVGKATIKMLLKNQVFNENYRGKFVVINQCKNYKAKACLEQKLGNDLSKQILKIPSILKKANCYVYAPKIKEISKLNELLLEDQILISIVAFNKNDIQSQILNNLTMILADLFY